MKQFTYTDVRDLDPLHMPGILTQLLEHHPTEGGYGVVYSVKPRDLSDLTWAGNNLQRLIHGDLENTGVSHENNPLLECVAKHFHLIYMAMVLEYKTQGKIQIDCTYLASPFAWVIQIRATLPSGAVFTEGEAYLSTHSFKTIP